MVAARGWRWAASASGTSTAITSDCFVSTFRLTPMALSACLGEVVARPVPTIYLFIFNRLLVDRQPHAVTRIVSLAAGVRRVRSRRPAATGCTVR